MRARTRSPLARSAGAFAAACVISILVSLFTTFLGMINFGPLQSLIEADNRVLYSLGSPPMRPAGPTSPVVFVDINAAALEGWPSEASGRTPRRLLAKILTLVRDQKPAAVFLDFDLRDSSDQDQALLEELMRPSRPPVLIPYFFESPSMPPCRRQVGLADALRPAVVYTPFDSAFDTGSLYKVHAALETGTYGLIRGACSSYRLRGATAEAWSDVPAAMVLATRLAGHRRAGVDWPPRLISPTWRLRAKSQGLSFGRMAAYTWIPAGKLFWTNVDLSPLAGAIVIIGATHHGGEDRHPTPVGVLPGALVHADIALELQYPAPGSGGPAAVIISFLIDFAFTLLAAALATAICWHPLHRKLSSGGEPTFGQRLWRLAGELLIVWSVWLAMTVLVVVLSRYVSGITGVWRFALVGSLCGTIIVLMIEVVAVIGDSASRAVERMVATRLADASSSMEERS
ncbi:MAG TPA: CHASE2 domain-containing protein [Caulobacteraceae bacterium]